MIEKSFLLRGKDLKINDYITVRHPTIEEIFDFGEKNYYLTIRPFVVKNEDLMVEYDDAGIDYTIKEDYDVFIDLLQIYQVHKIDFSWLLDCSLLIEDGYFIDRNENGEYVVKYSDIIILDKLSYHKIADFVRTINNIPSKSHYNPGNEATRKIIIENERDKRKNKKDTEEDSYLIKIVSALVWKNTSGVNYTNVWKFSLYQVFDGILTLNKFDKIQHIIHGIYSGVIDSSHYTSKELSWID